LAAEIRANLSNVQRTTSSQSDHIKMYRSLSQLSSHLFLLFFACLATKSSHAQLKVAQYSHEKYGTDKFEKFEFWTKAGRHSEISYSYGEESKKVALQYLGKVEINGDSCFKVRFSNGYVLYIIPTDFHLRIIDSLGKYNETFTWEYEGPSTA
jgi:hypothetical protein